MKRKPRFLLGTALLSAVIGYGVAIGTEVPPRSEKKDASPAEKGATRTTVQVSGKPAVKTATKPVADSAEKKSADRKPVVERSADQDAILATGVTYLKAYAEGDAKAVAAHFTVDAEYIDEQGKSHQGREGIAAVMTACFATNPDSNIELDINSIRVVSPGVAIEDGVTTLTGAANAEPVVTHYTAVHVKMDGKWLLASVRERAPKERRQHRAQLEQLGWLKGDWVDESDDSIVLFSCGAADNGNFLMRKFVIQIAGEEALSGTQRIGWDPVQGKLRAWTFDSEGGYTDGFWHRDGDRWVLKTTGVTADGRTASSTAIYTFVNEHTMTWQSVDHEIAGVEMPDSELVTIVRRAPSPATAENAVSSKSN